MNILKGIVKSVEVNGSLSLVRTEIAEITLTAIVVDTPETAPYLKEGHLVKVIFKETEVIIGKGTQHQISLRNKLPGRIIKIETDNLLSKVVVETAVGKIASIITSNAVKNLPLQPGEEVTAMIKTNEMMLSG
ncbi:MAG: TOBE domain-containing protein [Bacteroidota bacterium]